MLGLQTSFTTVQKLPQIICRVSSVDVRNLPNHLQIECDPTVHLRFAGRSTWGPGRVDKETLNEMLKEGLIKEVPGGRGPGGRYKQGRDSIMRSPDSAVVIFVFETQHESEAVISVISFSI